MTNRDYQKELLDAIRANDAEAIKVLLREGADPNSSLTGSESSPINAAISTGSLNVISLLIGHGADLSPEKAAPPPPLHFAVEKNHLGATRLLLDHVDPNESWPAKSGTSPLHTAKSADIAQLLLDSGAKRLARDSKGQTPLHTAATAEVAAKLYHDASDLEIKDHFGRTPRESALDRGANGVAESFRQAFLKDQRSRQGSVGHTDTISPHEESKLTLYDKVINWAKNNRLIVAGLLFATIVVGLGSVTKGFDDVAVFLRKYGFLSDQTSPNKSIADSAEANRVFNENMRLLNAADATDGARAGAIYAMQSVLDYNPAFHQAVVKTLVTFVREKRSRTRHPDCVLDPDFVTDTVDVRAAIDTIGHRATFLDTEPWDLLNFSDLCLQGTVFSNMWLNHASFENSDLRRANFDGAWVQEANFASTYMDYRSVKDASEIEKTPDGFREMVKKRRSREFRIATRFNAAHLERSWFNGSCLRGVDFDGAHFEKTGFADADISLATFTHALNVDSTMFYGVCQRNGSEPTDLPAGINLKACTDPPDLGPCGW